MNKMFKFSGKIRNVEAKEVKCNIEGKSIFRKLQRLCVVIIENSNEEVFYLDYWGNKKLFKTDEVGHFIGYIKYNRITSKKAVQTGTDIPFEYPSWNFVISHFISTTKELVEFFDKNFKDWKHEDVLNEADVEDMISGAI